MWFDVLTVSVDFLQYWTGIVFGAFVIMTLVLHRRKQERLVDMPPANIFVPRPFSAEELREFDGVRNPLIFVGVKGVVYNVAKEWYGPQSPYNAFAGHEASRQLGKTKVGREEANADWTTLSGDHLQTLDEWEERFLAKYIPVGWFVPDGSYFAKGLEYQP